MNPKIEQIKKVLIKARDFQNGGNLALGKEFVSLEEKIDENIESVTSKIESTKSELEERINTIQLTPGEKGDQGDRGDDGDDYILTESDKKEIAQSITVPVVEKVIERTEVVIEKPIVTEITNVTNEIKEVALYETPDQITDKVNLGKPLIKKERVEGLTDLEKNIKAQLYTGISETRALELIRANSSTSSGGVTSVNSATGAVTLTVAQSAIYDLEWNGTELRIPFASNTKDGFLTATDHIVFSTKVSSTSSPYSTIATDGAGTVDFNGNAYQKLALQNSVQVDMTGDIQDYDTGGGPIGGSGTTIVRVTPDASGYRFGGVAFFDPPEFNSFLIIFNTSETESFTVPHEDVGSDAENRFSNPLLADITLNPLEALFYIYDPNATYWRNVGRTGGSSSGVADGDYGDIIVSGGGLIWDITGNAVGNAEISDVASTKITGMIQASNVNVGMIWAINNNFFM